MLPLILAAATLTLGTTAEPQAANMYFEGAFAHIVYSDLDLNSKAGRARLVGRIEQAARLLCDLPDPDPLPPFSSQERCYRTAAFQGLSQMISIEHRQAD